jgi:hypothetical protein
MKFPPWRRREEELEEEIQSHLRMAIRDRMERGESAEEAESAVRREFGNLGLIKETTRGMWGWAEAKLIFDDMRYGLRMLRKSPGWTAVMCAVLALGIGLTMAIFNLAYGILLRALPYPDPERIVALYYTNTVAAAAGYMRINVNAPTWMEWRAQTKLFEDIAIIKAAVNFNLTGGGPPERAQGARASWNLPRTLDVQPILGRSFSEEEALRDAKVAVLSYGFWDRRFARDPAIVGRKILLNDESFEVIGVMPPNFRYPTSDLDLLTPLFIPPDEIRAFGHFYYRAVGRLKPGVSLSQAQAELSAISERLTEQRPHGPGGGLDGALVESLLDSYVGEFRTTLYVLLAAVGSLLLICCVNLGGLLIVRANARTSAQFGRRRRRRVARLAPAQSFSKAPPTAITGFGDDRVECACVGVCAGVQRDCCAARRNAAGAAGFASASRHNDAAGLARGNRRRLDPERARGHADRRHAGAGLRRRVAFCEPGRGPSGESGVLASGRADHGPAGAASQIPH